MKDKIKRFFIDKKELLIFVAVVIVVFATVITIATLALSDVPANSDNPTLTPGTNDGPVDGGNEEEPTPAPVIKKFALPITGEYEVVRIFFDVDLTDEELVSAVISNGSYMVESKGMSYAKADNSSFDVCAVYDGTVESVVEDELEGTTIVVKHADGVQSIYSATTDVLVKEGDLVLCGDVLAKASTSFNDVEAGVHVHLQIKVNDTFVNPADVFGKELTEVSSSK